MKRRYHIEQERAVHKFRQLARQENPQIQMILPMADVVGLLQEGVGHLLREAGLALMNLVMEEEIRHLAGERHQQHPNRHAHRWGKENGYCVVDGQKVPIRRTRLRNAEKREQRLGSYELFQRSTPLEGAVWDKVMRGLSTRNYGAVVKEFREAYGIEKSAVSDNFIEASREKLKELMERPLGELRLCAVLIDGTPFKDRQMIVALGISVDGRKTVLGLREGATENATVVSELLSDLAGRGLDFSVPRVYVLDGGKALATALRRQGRGSGLDPALPDSQAAQRPGSPAGKTPAGGEQGVAECLRHDRIRRRQARAGTAASGVDGSESECRPQPGGRPGGDPHGSPSASASQAPPHFGHHQCDRVRLLDCGDGLPQCETLACGGPNRALGGIGSAGRRASVPKSTRLSRDPAAHGFLDQRRLEQVACQGGRRCVTYDGRGLLTFNGVPDNLLSFSCST